MDKYDRLAAEIVFKHFGAKADMSLAAVIAAALRESAAEAFEEAAKIIKRHAALCGPDFAKLECGVLEHLENERNKLTTAPPRAAGERNK